MKRAVESPITPILDAHRDAFAMVAAARAEVERHDPFRGRTIAPDYEEFTEVKARSPEWRAAHEQLEIAYNIEAERFAALVAVARMLTTPALIELLRYACQITSKGGITGDLAEDRGVLALLAWVLSDDLDGPAHAQADNDDGGAHP
jgi:hypothetical protein